MNILKRAALAAAVAALCSSVSWANTIKVGVIAEFSGSFAMHDKQHRETIETYVAKHGKQAGDHTIEFIYTDVGGPNPDVAKTLAQELLILDEVDSRAGFTTTPNALAVAPLIDQSETPTVIFNATTPSIDKGSPFLLRTSYALPQVTALLAEWAFDQASKTVAIALSDFRPGIDAEKAFKTPFAKKGGKIVDAIRMPVATTGYTPFIQRVRSQNANANFAFLPGGPATFGLIKTYNENGLAAGQPCNL